MKQHPRLTTTIFSLAFGICFLFTMAACAPQQNADGELAFYANARSEGDSKFLDSGVLSLERGFYDETNANHVLCLNATAQPNEYCEWVTYESTNNNIQIGSTPGAWGGFRHYHGRESRRRVFPILQRYHRFLVSRQCMRLSGVCKL